MSGSSDFFFLEAPLDSPFNSHHSFFFSFQELGEKAGSKFKEAYDLVKKYLMKRKINSNLNARRFLTLNQNGVSHWLCDFFNNWLAQFMECVNCVLLSSITDKVAQAKTCLLRLTGSFDGFDDEDVKFDEELSDNALASEDEDDVTEESNVHTDGRSPNEKAKIEAILKDLETLPANMTVSATVSILELLQMKVGVIHFNELKLFCSNKQKWKKKQMSSYLSFAQKNVLII